MQGITMPYLQEKKMINPKQSAAMTPKTSKSNALFIFRKGKGSVKKYLTRWVGYDHTFDTWLTREDLENAPDLLRDFEESCAAVSQ